MTPTDQRILAHLHTLYPDVLEALQTTREVLEEPRILPDDIRRLLYQWANIGSRLSDSGDLLGTSPERLTKFWSRIKIPPHGSDSVGLSAPCWISSYAEVKGGTIVSWRNRNQPTHRVVWELLHGRPLKPHERLRRICPNHKCVNVDQHYVRSENAPTPLPLRDDAVGEALSQALEEERYCSRGHRLAPHQLARNCSPCRQERRESQKQADATLWYGIEEPPHQGVERETLGQEDQPTPTLEAFEPQDDFERKIEMMLSGIG